MAEKNTFFKIMILPIQTKVVILASEKVANLDSVVL